MEEGRAGDRGSGSDPGQDGKIVPVVFPINDLQGQPGGGPGEARHGAIEAWDELGVLPGRAPSSGNQRDDPR